MKVIERIKELKKELKDIDELYCENCQVFLCENCNMEWKGNWRKRDKENEEMSKVSELEILYGEYFND